MRDMLHVQVIITIICVDIFDLYLTGLSLRIALGLDPIPGDNAWEAEYTVNRSADNNRDDSSDSSTSILASWPSTFTIWFTFCITSLMDTKLVAHNCPLHAPSAHNYLACNFQVSIFYLICLVGSLDPLTALQGLGDPMPAWATVQLQHLLNLKHRPALL